MQVFSTEDGSKLAQGTVLRGQGDKGTVCVNPFEKQHKKSAQQVPAKPRLKKSIVAAFIQSTLGNDLDRNTGLFPKGCKSFLGVFEKLQ